MPGGISEEMLFSLLGGPNIFEKKKLSLKTREKVGRAAVYVFQT